MPNFIRYIFSIIACFSLFALPCRAQHNELYSFNSMAEKIYLQLDSKVYGNDQTIWFKAIVSNAVDHAATKLSAVLYTELVDANANIIERKLTRIDNGIGEGFFQLNKTYPEGIYLLRAYTEWNRNFDGDFFFAEYIRIFSATASKKIDPVRNVTLTLEQNGQRRLKASFDPLAIDSLHNNNLDILLLQEEKTDTLSIKKNAGGSYLLDYTISANSRYLAMRMQTKNNSTYTKTVLLTNGYPNLQFFPESGELVHGIPALLGLKAMDSTGKGEMATGEIINSKGALISSFKTNRLGIGTVRLPEPDSSERYFARMTGRSSSLEKLFPLPVSNGRGNVLSVKKDGEKIEVEGFSNYLEKDSILVRVSCRGLVYFDIKGLLKKGGLSFSLAANTLPDGIIVFTMMTDPVSPVAERLYFNNRPEKRIQLSLSVDKKNYTRRELTNLSIKASDKDGQPVNASISALVVNKTALGQLPDRQENIYAYFLLSSELKGKIDEPGYYFTEDTGRHDDLDALLLTQGWRKYNYSKTTGHIVFKPETELSVTGIVTGQGLVHKARPGAGITMMSFGQKHAVQTAITDSSGRFRFNVNNEYSQSMNVLVQGTNQLGKKKDYAITIDKKEFPPVVFDQLQAAEKPDSTVQLFVKKSIEDRKLLDAYIATSEGILLEDVVLKRYVLTPERKLVADKYGSPKIVIEGDDIRKKESGWSYGLYSVLLFNYPDKIRMERMEDGTLYARLHNGLMTLVVVDGIPVGAQDYSLIPNIPPSEVRSFELIEHAKDFFNLFCNVFPRGCGMGPDAGNVIAIYTYGRKGLFGANQASGITKAAVPVYAAPREFYAPKWDHPDTAALRKPDLRSVIHWSPTLKTDSTGNTSTSFYNADTPGTMQVIVEAIAENGAIGYRQLSYSVKERD